VDVADDFNRADGPLVGSVTSVGGAAWQQLLGTGWTVASGRATFGVASSDLASGYSYAVVPTNTPDGVVSITVPQVSDGRLGIIFRTVDASNLWLWWVKDSNWELVKRVNGNWSGVTGGSGTVTPAPGDRLAVHMNGPSVELRQNDEILFSTTEANDLQTATKHGIYGWGWSTALPRLVDDFEVRPSAPGPASETVFVADDFNRGDNGSLVGSVTPIGARHWEDLWNGNKWSNQNNQAYFLANGGNVASYAVVPTGVADAVVSVTIPQEGDYGRVGLIVRAKDAANYWLWYIESGTGASDWSLGKVIIWNLVRRSSRIERDRDIDKRRPPLCAPPRSDH
jgi:hypothetical protein